MIRRGDARPSPLDVRYELTPEEVGALQSAGKDREAFLKRNGWWPKEDKGTGRINSALTKIVRGQPLIWAELSILMAAARDRESYRRTNGTWEAEWTTTERIEAGIRKLRAAFYARETQ